MLKKPAVILNCIVFITVFLSCGIEEHYYLPQVPQGAIVTVTNTSATINFLPIPDDYYYAGHYSIFYKIYASNFNTLSISSSDYNRINPSLNSDYNYFLPISNPANTSSTVSLNTFTNRKFFELEFEGIDNNFDMLPKIGGTLIIVFPTNPGDYPTASLDGGGENKLLRSSKLTSPEPSDRYFLNTTKLRDAANANPNKNADVAENSGNMSYTYVTMYIVAVGTHPTNFTTIYSKPTFISVFKLPDSN
jgi:hypothetical protein